MSEWQFTLDLRIDDPEQLLTAALDHSDGPDSRDDLLNDDGTVDIGKCLVILLDPGTLPGGEIFGSSQEEVELHTVDFGGERN
jgi:hypothetical protein